MKLFRTSLVVVILGWSCLSSATPINFNDHTIEGFAGQDDGGTATILDGGATLNLDGNTWKSVLGVNTTVTASTMIYFDYMSTVEGELQGLGLENNNSITAKYLFKLFGSQSTSANTTFENYQLSDGWKEYAINLGSISDFFGSSFNRIVFMNDHDNGAKDGNSFFRNVEICDGCARTVVNAAIPEPSSILLLGLGIFGLVARRFAR